MMDSECGVWCYIARMNCAPVRAGPGMMKRDQYPDEPRGESHDGVGSDCG